MAPARRHTGPLRALPQFAAIHDALRRTRRRRYRHRRRLWKLDAPAKIPETNGQGAENMGRQLAFEELSEDILHHIHSLMPIQDAARAACVSRGFLRSWRHYSNLILDYRTLRLDGRKFEGRKAYFIDSVDRILRNHHDNVVTVKTLELDLLQCFSIQASYLDRWLPITVKSGIQELKLVIPLLMDKIYNFPCSVLSEEAAASSIRSLSLFTCAFHSTSTLGCLRRLKDLNLSDIYITEEGLGHLLSESSALERLVISPYRGIRVLKIPCTLHQLKYLSVTKRNIKFGMLKVTEISAPNLCSFDYDGTPIKIYISNSSQLKNVVFSCVCMSGILSYARSRLPSIAQNIESLTLCGCIEDANTPMLPSKLPHLKNLEIGLFKPEAGFSPSYDVFSLVSFLDAAPVLEYFIMRVDHDAMELDTAVGDDKEYQWKKLECRYNSLRKVMIMGFCSDKRLIELTVHILESTRSLEHLTLDTTYATSREIGLCWPMTESDLDEVRRAVEAAGTYIAGRVPSSVQFEVLEPCSQCHSDNQ